MSNLFNPSDEHQFLRETVRKFAEREIDAQALEYDRDEKFGCAFEDNAVLPNHILHTPKSLFLKSYWLHQLASQLLFFLNYI